MPRAVVAGSVSASFTCAADATARFPRRRTRPACPMRGLQGRATPTLLVAARYALAAVAAAGWIVSLREDDAVNGVRPSVRRC